MYIPRPHCHVQHKDIYGVLFRWVQLRLKRSPKYSGGRSEIVVLQDTFSQVYVAGSMAMLIDRTLTFSSEVMTSS